MNYIKQLQQDLLTERQHITKAKEEIFTIRRYLQLPKFTGNPDCELFNYVNISDINARLDNVMRELNS